MGVHALVWAGDEPAELTQTRAQFQKDMEFNTRPIRERYLSKLETLKRALGSRGDARGAVAVQEEIDRLKVGIGDVGVAKFAGSWSLTYSNGAVRNYVIAVDGTVKWVDENGKPINLTSKLHLDGAECTVSFPGDERLERLTMAGSKLFAVEHFAPKTYPSKPPVLVGVAVKSTTP